MSALQTALGSTAVLLALVAVLGILRRGLGRASRFFPLYLVCVAASDALILAAPSRFHTWSFWMAKESAVGVLKLCLAVEIAALSFHALRGARRASYLLASLVLGATFAALVWAPSTKDFHSLAIELQPRLANGTAVLFASTWACVMYYRVPLHRLHRAILRGMVLYLLVNTFALRAMATLGWTAWGFVRYLDGGFYVTVLAYWAWEIWRPQSDLEDPHQLLPALQPWRARLSPPL